VSNSAPSDTVSQTREVTAMLPRIVEGTSISGSSGMSYRPLLELGEGGMARIVLALATGPGGFNKLVVLKVMRTGQDTTEIRRLLLAEARLSARLNHPNVVQVHEVVHAADAPYLVMEYLDGRPLSALRVSQTLTPGMLMTVISEALVGLHHAHELSDFDGTALQIVHRDVSPHNIFVTYDGVVKVLDFGIAKMQHEVSNTETGEVKGKLAYMPPEQLLGENVDRRADIFAVGGMLWEVAAGARMWANVSQANLMHRLISGDIPRPSAVATIAPELERIIVRATAAKPEDRYETALAMQQELDAYLESTGQRGTLRDIGAILAETFKQDRQQRARSIKEALKHNSMPPAANQQLDLITGSESKIDPAPKRRGVLLAGAALVVALLGLGISLRPSRGAVPIASAAAPLPSTISLSVHASPPEAKVKIDEQEYGDPNLSLTLPRDDRPHQMVVSADGFVPDTRSVTFDKSLTVDVALRPVEQAAQAEPRATTNSVHGKSAPGGSRHSALGAVGAPTAAARPSADCSPPYFFDRGIKTYKPQCL
jgi:eukaryotic-like serine/threonine-protein kinase